MTKINIEYDDQQVQRAIRRLLRAGADLSPAMRTIADHLAASTRQTFDDETAPDGSPWQKLKPSTIKQRERSGYVPINILGRSGDLKASIIGQSDASSVVVGTDRIYATTHQFGAKKGVFGKTKRGAPIPWGDIPARPFLGVNANQEENIQQIVLDYIKDQWR